ncbi:efflux RND transporter periplasmic adaptor subunit [Burkholderia sp. 22PA0099]|uniref:efflux RND transporter periplasmic adaptor subunit n=1 Tax=Burkholderia sp. 22PA0099 TaxID=3237372 RepID=UPI0039C03E40
MKRHSKTRGALIVATCLGSAVALTACDKNEAPRQVAPQVGVFTLDAQKVTISTTLPGRTDAWRVAEVRPQVSGIIQKRMFEEGSDVKRGQQLYQIDEAPYRAVYDKARAALIGSRQLAQRYQKLVGDNAISKQQYDDAQSAYRQAQADVESARINLAYTKVYSPIPGRIGRSAVTEGALVTNGQPQALAVVQQLDPIYVDVTESSIDMLRLRRELRSGQLKSIGQDAAAVRLELEDGTQYPVTGSLKFSEVSVDEGTGMVTMRALFGNPEHELLPGMFVHARLNEGERNNVVVVPQQAVMRDTTGAALAWTVDANGIARQQRIEVDRTLGNAWLVSGGLKPGDRVVTEGLQRLKPGMLVSPQPATNVHLQLSDDPASAQPNPSSLAPTGK